MNPLSLIPGFSTVSGIATAVAAAALLGGAVWATHAIDNGAYQKLVAAQANAKVQAVQVAAKADAAQAKVQAQASTEDAVAQQKIVTRTITIIKEIPAHVTPAQDAAATQPGAVAGCVTWGFVRVLDAAALGLDPSDLQLPSGVTDDTCTALDPSAVAGNVASNYGAAAGNAKQLNDLEAEITKQDAAANAAE